MTTGRINQVAVSSSTTRVRLGNRAPPTSAQLVRDGCVQLALKRSGSGSRGCRPLPRESGSFRSPIDQQQQQRAGVTRPGRSGTKSRIIIIVFERKVPFPEVASSAPLLQHLPL